MVLTLGKTIFKASIEGLSFAVESFLVTDLEICKSNGIHRVRFNKEGDWKAANDLEGLGYRESLKHAQWDAVRKCRERILAWQNGERKAIENARGVNTVSCSTKVEVISLDDDFDPFADEVNL